MLPDNLDLAQTDGIENKAPGIFPVLGAAVLDIAIVGVFWFIAMFFASAFWAISEPITQRGQMPSSQPGTLALLLISMPTLYLAIFALSAWRGRKLLLKQTPNSSTRLALVAFMTGFATFAVTVSSTYLLNAYGMELKAKQSSFARNAEQSMANAHYYFGSFYRTGF